MSQMRMTKQRAIILETLCSVKTHPTADEIYGMVRQKLPRISLGTVYRNLDQLSNTGSIRRLERAGMQMRFDGDMTPHLHVRCKHCGVVGDVFSSVSLSAENLECTSGFSIEEADIEFVGVCPACQSPQ